MKKLLKRIIAVVFVAILFAAPSNALAASTPVLKAESDGYKYFMYEPEAYYLEAGRSMVLTDTTNNGWWHVPAGKTFYTNSYLNESGTYRVIISQKYVGIVYDSGIINDFTIQAVLPSLATDADYIISLEAYSNINVFAYDGILYD